MEDEIKTEILAVVKSEQYVVLALASGLTAQGRFLEAREKFIVLENIEGYWKKNDWKKEDKIPTFAPNVSLNKVYVPYSEVIYFIVGE